MAGRPKKRARNNPEHVSLKDIGRDTKTIDGVTYAEMGAEVILGRDNPGLFPFPSSKFYLMKSTASFKLQSGQVVEGQVLEMHPKHAVGIILPIGAISNPRDIRVTIENLKRLAAPDSGATDNERQTALRTLASLHKKLAESAPAGRNSAPRRTERARSTAEPDPDWYKKWVKSTPAWHREVPKGHWTMDDYGTGPSFKGKDLSGQDLRDRDMFDFRSVNFRGANLAAADLRGQDLRGADFTDADLRGADLRGVSLLGTLFQRTRLAGVKLTADDLWGVQIVDPDFSGGEKMLSSAHQRLR